MAQDVADIRANKNENIRHAAEVIGKSARRKKVFETIYRGKSPVKTVSQIMKATLLSQVAVLQEGAKLAANQLVEQTKVGKETGYRKIRFFVDHKARILSIVKNPKLAEKLPTKQRPAVAGKVIKIALGNLRPQIKQLFIDDFDSFKLAHKVAAGNSGINLSTTREEVVKNALLKIIGETRKYKDWGGEKSDFYTSRLIYKGRRITAAFALKGRATQGILVPKKMGANGDQIARLFTVAAQAFFIVYHSDVDESVVTQLQTFALGKAMSGQKIYFSVIDGKDLDRLAKAYRNFFK